MTDHFSSATNPSSVDGQGNGEEREPMNDIVEAPSWFIVTRWASCRSSIKWEMRIAVMLRYSRNKCKTETYEGYT